MAGQSGIRIVIADGAVLPLVLQGRNGSSKRDNSHFQLTVGERIAVVRAEKVFCYHTVHPLLFQGNGLFCFCGNAFRRNTEVLQNG